MAEDINEKIRGRCRYHKYRRRNLTKNKNKEAFYVFKCVDCPHYIRTELAVGTQARCYKSCGNLVTITSKHASEVAKPVCDNCIVKSSKRKKMQAELDNIMDKIFSEL